MKPTTPNAILPTPLRVGADERYTGRGVTIAFLDSGFYPHPDLTQPENRVLHYTHIAHEGSDEADYQRPNLASWHGTMTSVVAAGNGFLSEGIYKGIASEAKVVLVKLGKDGRIHDRDIQLGLEWVIDHREEFGIRVVNISCGGDAEASYLTDELSRTAEDAVRAGLVLVVAVGNQGHLPGHGIYPPASVPAVITVGGINDRNTLIINDSEMYNSSYGPTVDGVHKPEVVAPSIWLAAPILPETPTASEAGILAMLNQTPTGRLNETLQEHARNTAELQIADALSPQAIRRIVKEKTAAARLINEYYKFVDGTSFAAPIVSSVVAQMLEANPRLTPQQVKRILIDTAIRLPEVPVDKQGWGAIIPARAVERAQTVAGLEGENVERGDDGEV
jgi:serine protease AprX